MTKILLVDDHSVVRRGLRHILESATEAWVVTEAENYEQALGVLGRESVDVVILDVGLPGRNGVALLKQIKKERPDLPVLMLSMHPEEQYGLRVLRAGASGYLSKVSDPERLLEALRKIVRGGKYISNGLAQTLAEAVAGDGEHQPHTRLSDREYEIFLNIATGKPVSKIAEKLCLSAKTVHTYRSRILQKMGIKNNAELIHYAVKHQLID